MAELDASAAQVLALVRLANRPSYETLSPAEARQMYRDARSAVSPDPPEVASVRDLSAPGPGGEIPLRLYRGAGTDPAAALPVLMFFHGGGWVIGGIDTHDVVCRWLANAAECAVVSVDYRLAPDAKFPAALDDCLAATNFVVAQAASLGIDGSRVAVGGDSAGGNLAAVVCLHARDHGGPQLRMQVLLYPATEFAMSHPSHATRGEGYVLTTKLMVWFRGQYLRSAVDMADWRASPLRAESFSGLPPAYVVTAGFDPLCDEGEDYARRMAAAGGRVTVKTLPGQIHGFMTMGRLIPEAAIAAQEAGQALKAAFT